MKRGRPKKGTGIDWSSVDWSRNNREISKHLRVSQTAVNKQRAKGKHRKSALLWERLGFQSKQDWANHNSRERRKINPPTEEQKLKAIERATRYYVFAYIRDGFKTKEEWNSWKLSERMKKPCAECGSINKIVLQKGTIMCRDCYNKKAAKKKSETGRGARDGKKRRLELKDYYIANLLGIASTTARNHPDLIETKREQIKILRELKPTKRTKRNAQEPKQPATSPR